MTHWTWWPLDLGRSVLELREDITPAGLSLELDLLDGGGCARTWAVWRLSESGRVIWMVEAGEA